MRIGTRTLKLTAWVAISLFVVVLTLALGSMRWGIGINVGPVLEIALYRGNVYGCVSTTQPITLSGPITLDVCGSSGWGCSMLWWPETRHDIWSDWLFIPLWLPAAVCLAVGVPAFVTLRRRARAMKNGACLKCGYMLTGLSRAAPCPECGRADPTPR